MQGPPAPRRSHARTLATEPAGVDRVPLTELVLLVHGRRSVDDADVEVFGDRDLLPPDRVAVG